MNLEPQKSGKLEVSLSLGSLTQQLTLQNGMAGPLRLADLPWQSGNIRQVLDGLATLLDDQQVQELFADCLRRRLSGSQRHPDVEEWRQGLLRTTQQSATQVLAALRLLLAGSEIFQGLTRAAEALGGERAALQSLDLESLLGSTKSISRAVRTTLLKGQSQIEPRVSHLLAPLPEDLAQIVRLTLELRHGIPQNGGTVARIANLLELPWIAGCPTPAHGFHARDLELMKEIERLPMPIPARPRGALDKQIQGRFKRTLIDVLKEETEAVQEKMLTVLQEVMSQADLQWHRFAYNNDAAWLLRLRDALQCGRLELRFVSCPDYSGMWGEAGKQFRFDFARLGTDVGVVAERGIPWVAAWARTLVKHIPFLTLTHVEATFEVEHGFKGSEEDLSRSEARLRIAESGAKISRHLEALTGVECRSIQFDDLKAPVAQAIEREAWLRQVRERWRGDAEFRGLIQSLFDARRSLYEKLHRKSGDGVDDAKLIEEAVLPQIGEYLMVGFTLAERDSAFTLAYDSSWMHEVSAAYGLPCVFGHRRGFGYAGA